MALGSVDVVAGGMCALSGGRCYQTRTDSGPPVIRRPSRVSVAVQPLLLVSSVDARSFEPAAAASKVYRTRISAAVWVRYLIWSV